MTVAACPPNTPPVHGVVVFSATEFRTSFPEFAAVSDALLQSDFALATLVLNNSCRSLVCDANVRQTLLYLLTAHVAALFQGANGQPPSGIVGRVSDATEGSVSVSAEYASEVSSSMAWFIQTQWGATFWQMTAPFRTMRYFAPPPNCCDGDQYLGPTGSGFGYGYNGGSA